MHAADRRLIQAASAAAAGDSSRSSAAIEPAQRSDGSAAGPSHQAAQHTSHAAAAAAPGARHGQQLLLTTGIIGRSPLKLPPDQALAFAPAEHAPAAPQQAQDSPHTPRATINMFGPGAEESAAASAAASGTGHSMALSTPTASEVYPATAPPGIPSALRT
jgi:hypothetical protein